MSNTRDCIVAEYEPKIILNTCPPPIPERKGQRHTFLESVLQAHYTLISAPRTTVHLFLETMLTWAGREPRKSRRYSQNVLDAYYLIGVIPHFNLSRDENCRINSYLVDVSDLHELRMHCLNAFFAHLARSDLFWNSVVSLEPFCTSELHEQLKPLSFSLDDTTRRIRLLVNLGALCKRGRSYSISQLGKSLSQTPMQMPISSYATSVKDLLTPYDFAEELNIIDWEE